MKKLLVLPVVLLAFTACTQIKPLTLDEQIVQIKKCEDAGLKASPVHSYSGIGGDDGVIRIDCEPK